MIDLLRKNKAGNWGAVNDEISITREASSIGTPIESFFSVLIYTPAREGLYNNFHAAAVGIILVAGITLFRNTWQKLHRGP